MWKVSYVFFIYVYILKIFDFLSHVKDYYEARQLGGFHRRKALRDPEVLAWMASSTPPIAVTSWAFDMLAETIFELPDVERVLRFISFFDNLQHSNIIQACDSERAICIMNCLATKEFNNWKNDYPKTKALLQVNIVSILSLY